MGADSAGTSGWSLTVRADAKVFRNGPYLMGFTDSFRMGQLLRYSLEPPVPTGDLSRFMATTMIDTVRSCLKDGGWAAKDSDRERGGQFLVGVAGRLFNIHSDFQVGEMADGYAAVGCGEDIARGALFATTGMAPKKRILLALQAAERHSAGVRAPFTVLSAK